VTPTLRQFTTATTSLPPVTIAAAVITPPEILSKENPKWKILNKKI
jgi:hypothetical protein